MTTEPDPRPPSPARSLMDRRRFLLTSSGALIGVGLAAFCPDHFARRDRAWATGDPAFHELNDRLQYLGAFSFRAPVPAYRHDAALFLHHRGWISSPTVPEGAPTRPDSDRDVLALIAADLEAHP